MKTANIPVLQLSIDPAQPAAFHYALGQELTALRERGVLVVGGGNIVHNYNHSRYLSQVQYRSRVGSPCGGGRD